MALMGASVLSGVPAAAVSKLTGPERAQAVGAGLLGQPAPQLVVKTIDGQTIDLGKLYGKKAVYVKFWATWCHPCREQMPHLEHAYQTAGSDLAVIAVDVGLNDNLEDVRTLRQKMGLTMPIVFDDGRLGEAFHLRVTPQHVIIGRDGRIQYVGWQADQRLDDAVAAARKPGQSRLANAALKTTTRYDVGQQLPNLSGQTLEGNTFHLQDPHVSVPTVLVFLLPWCEGDYLAPQRPQLAARCKRVREQVESLSRNDSLHVRWLAVASGLWTSKDDLSAYQEQYKPAMPLMLDESGDWFRSFGVMQPPTLVIANSQGRIIRRVDELDPNLPATLASATGS
jgi:peroxiredoxin